MSAKEKTYWRVLFVTLLIFVMEIVSGKIFGSLALLSDSFHVLGDAVAAAAAIVICRLAEKDPCSRKVWENRGGGFQGFLLLCSCGWICWEIYQRIGTSYRINFWPVVVAAALGALGNWWQHRMLSGVTDDDSNTAGLHAHILTDFWQSIAVIASTIFIALTGWMPIDIIVSCAIAAVLFFTGGKYLILACLGRSAAGHHHDHDHYHHHH